MEPPKDERRVLTWVRDKGGYQYWQIDSYLRTGSFKFDGWHEANRCGEHVMDWQELPPRKERYETTRQ